MQDDVLHEFLGILDRSLISPGNHVSTEDVIRSLPRTNEEFQTCQLKRFLQSNLEGTTPSPGGESLGNAVDAAIAAGYLEDRAHGCVRPDAVDSVLSVLISSSILDDVVKSTRDALRRAAGGPSSTIAGTGALEERIGRRSISCLDSSEATEAGVHTKKKAARRQDWGGRNLDWWGGSGEFGPRVDIEATLAQLEGGLVAAGAASRSTGAGAAGSAIDALDTLTRADPETFQFGNHWPTFIELANRALESRDPAVHAKAVTLHWVMFEKAMGMNAADLCEALLAHTLRYFEATVHVVSDRVPHPHTNADGEKGDVVSGGVGRDRMMIVGDSELICAARQARALHGMLMTIHEAFQHLPERRIWGIVERVFALLEKSADRFQHSQSETTFESPTAPVNNAADVCRDGNKNSTGGTTPVDPWLSEDEPSWNLPAALLPAHFLAVAGSVDQWFPSWLRVLPTGRLVRAVNNSRLVAAMIQRCDGQGRAPLHLSGQTRHPSSDHLDAVAGVPTSSPNLKDTAVSVATRAAPRVLRHRLSVSTMTPVAGSFGWNGGATPAAPMGRVLWLSLGELDRALLLQSLSFLGTLATHCRGAMRPVPPLCGAPVDEAGDEAGRCEGEQDDLAKACERGSKDRHRTSGGSGDLENIGSEGGFDQGREVLGALVRCVRREFGRVASETDAPSALLRQAETVKRSRDVRWVALEHIRRLARATVGTKPTPFAPECIDGLLSTLNVNDSMVEPERGTIIDHGSHNFHGARRRHAGLEHDPAILEALADVAGVLLSSRGSSDGFFVQGKAGTEASRSLQTLVRFTAQLAREACFLLQDMGNRDNRMHDGRHLEREGEGSSILTPTPSHYKRQLAVDFACVLTQLSGCTPVQRAAGWRALWQNRFPQTMAEYVNELGRCRCDCIPGEDTHRGSRSPNYRLPRAGACGCPCDLSDCKQNEDLRRRLVLSLAEWARDMSGLNALRRVGLVQPCASYLSQEVALRHLFPSTRKECPDQRALALVARLALCREGLDGLVCQHDGVVDGVDQGLHELGQSENIAAMLQSAAPELGPCVADGSEEGNAGPLVTRRAVRGDVIGEHIGDLRCLDFVRRLTLSRSGWRVGMMGSEVAQDTQHRWVQWAVACALSGQSSIGGEYEGCEESEQLQDYTSVISEDIRLVGLKLVSELTNDLTSAVEIEVRWSVSSELQRNTKEVFEAQTASMKVGSINAMLTSKPRATPLQGEATPQPMDVESGENVSTTDELHVDGDADVPDGILDPVALARARLLASLSLIGGPGEARHIRFRQLQRAQAVAGGVAAAPGGSTCQPPAWQQAHCCDLTYFPAHHLQDEEWFAAAASCVPTVIASLAKPGYQVDRGKAAFALLREAATRDCPHLLGGQVADEHLQLVSPAVADCSIEGGRVNGRRHIVNNHSGDRPTCQRSDSCSNLDTGAVVGSLSFSYACGLGVAAENSKQSFKQGMSMTLGTAAALTSSWPLSGVAGTSHSAAPAPAPHEYADSSAHVHCDWFAVVVFLLSRGDGEASSELLGNLARGRVPRAAIVWPLAGRNFAITKTSVAEAVSPSNIARTNTVSGTLGGHKSSPEREMTSDYLSESDAVPPHNPPSPSCDHRTVVRAETSQGDPPLLLLAALVEELVEEELPLLTAAMRVAGWAVAPLAVRWMYQCMLGVVDWAGVVAYISLALLRGAEFQVYFVVAVLQCTQSAVVEAASLGRDLTNILGRGDALSRFDVPTALLYVEQLADRHQDRCVGAIRDYFFTDS